MKIACSKIRHQELPFDEANEDYKFIGVLKPQKNNLIKLESVFEVSLQMHCDRCGELYPFHQKDEFNCLISDGPYDGFEATYDVIESLDGFVDLTDIAQSEISLIQSDYNYCENCSQ